MIEFCLDFVRSIPVQELFIICLPILLLLIVMEYCREKKLLHVETTRKIIHMGTGVIIAFQPFFVDYDVLKFLSVGLLMIILLSYRFQIFKSIHAVKRVTIGEILYPLGIAICAFLEPAPWMFAAAILHLALADTFAALAGIRWGHKSRYYIVTHGKSLVGSVSFFVTSLLIFAGCLLFVTSNPLPSAPLLLAFCPVVLTLLENVSLFGSDDITIPIAVIVLLSGLPS